MCFTKYWLRKRVTTAWLCCCFGRSCSHVDFTASACAKCSSYQVSFPPFEVLLLRFSKTLRIENRVSSRDCQLTFERYCMYVYRTSMTWSAPYMTTGETASNAVAIVLFQKISTTPPCIEGTLHKTPPTLEFLFLENKINPPPIQNFSENYIHPHNPWKNAFWQENVLKWTLQTLKAV